MASTADRTHGIESTLSAKSGIDARGDVGRKRGTTYLVYPAAFIRYVVHAFIRTEGRRAVLGRSGLDCSDEVGKPALDPLRCPKFGGLGARAMQVAFGFLKPQAVSQTWPPLQPRITLNRLRETRGFRQAWNPFRCFLKIHRIVNAGRRRAGMGIRGRLLTSSWSFQMKVGTHLACKELGKQASKNIAPHSTLTT